MIMPQCDKNATIYDGGAAELYTLASANVPTHFKVSSNELTFDISALLTPKYQYVRRLAPPSHGGL
jgi:hypothetical protein